MMPLQISQDIDRIFTEAARLREEAQRIMIHSRNLRQRLILEDAITKLESGFVAPARQQSSSDREGGMQEQGSGLPDRRS
jgi:hypothetical protein